MKRLPAMKIGPLGRVWSRWSEAVDRGRSRSALPPLIGAATLVAKIHTIAWTPGILSHPTLKIAMNANWWSLWGRWVKEHLGQLSKSEALGGIRILILMALRRLNSARFFTGDYRPEVYAETGMRRVNDNGFADVLRRRFPDLAPALV